MIRIIVTSLVFWSALTAQLRAQTSFIAARHVADQSMVTVLRQLSQELAVDVAGNATHIKFVMCSQIDLGDIDGAVATMKSATSTAASRNTRWDAIRRIEGMVDNSSYLREFLERDELAIHPHRRSIQNTCRLSMIRKLISLENSPFPEAWAILQDLDSPDACVVTSGEKETISDDNLLDTWALYVSERARAGDIQWVIKTMNETRSALARKRLAYSIFLALARAENPPDRLAEFSSDLLDKSIRDESLSRQVVALIEGKRFQESVNLFQDLVNKSPIWAVATSLDLATGLNETGERALAIGVAETTISLLEQILANSGEDEAGFHEMFHIASLQLIAGRIDTSIDCAENAIYRFRDIPRETRAGKTEYRLAQANCNRYLEYAARFLVQEDQIESIERLFIITADTDSGISLALSFLRQVHEHKALMYEDAAYRHFLNSLTAIEDLDSRSARVFELASERTLPLSPEQRLELLRTGKSRYYRHEVITQYLKRDVRENHAGENLNFWIDELSAIVADEGDEIRDEYYFYSAMWLSEAGRFAEAVTFAEKLAEPEYVATFLQQTLQYISAGINANEITDAQIDQLIKFVVERPHLNIAQFLGRHTRALPLELRSRLNEMARQRLDQANTEDCRELSKWLTNLGLNVFELEKQYSRLRTIRNTDWVVVSIVQATEGLSIDDCLEQVAGLKIDWFRDMCESVVAEKIISSGFEPGLRYVISATDTKSKLVRFKILLANWASSNRFDNRVPLDDPFGGRM